MPTQQSKQVVMTKMNKKKEKAHAHAIKQVSRSGEDNQKKVGKRMPEQSKKQAEVVKIDKKKRESACLGIQISNRQ